MNATTAPGAAAKFGAEQTRRMSLGRLFRRTLAGAAQPSASGRSFFGPGGLFRRAMSAAAPPSALGRLISGPGSRSRLALAVAALLSAPVSGAAAQESSEQGVLADARFVQAEALFEAWLDAKMAYEKIPGMSMGLVHDQELVWAKGYGYAHPAERVPATPATLYSICSISKLFTAVGVMQQRDEHRLRLSDAVADHLPWFAVEQAYAGSGPVTVEGLLTHSSGLPRESAHPYWTGPEYRFPTRQEVVDGLAGQETLYPAARYFQYSNLGITLAGQILERLSGANYHEYVRTRILVPLGMTDTYTDIPAEHEGGRLATGYARLRRDGERARAPVFEARGIAPAAGFAASVEDLARFASWQFRLLGEGGDEVLAASTLREMHRVHWVDPDFETMWGLGFAVSQRDGERTVGHGGSCPGFRSTLQLLPDRKLAGVVMINAQGTNPNQVWAQMAKVLGPALATVADDPGGAPDRSAGLAEFEGLYESGWGETAVLRWNGSLAALRLPVGDPLDALVELEREEGGNGDMFRRVRDDGELGEAYVFDRGADGRIARLSVHGNFSLKTR